MHDVAIIAPFTRPVPPVRGGGVQIGIDEVARRFREFRPIVFSVADTSLPATHRVGNIEYIHIDVTPSQKCTHFLSVRSLKNYHYYCYLITRYLNARQPRIVHVRVNPWFIGPIYRHLTYRPKIILQHHTCPFSRSMRDWEIRKIMDKIDCFTGVSHFVIKKEVLDRLPAYRQKCKVIYNGVNISQFRPQWEKRSGRTIRRAKMGYDEEDIVMLYVGQIREDKGVLTVVRAFTELSRRYRNLHLLIVGSPSGGKDGPSKKQQAFFEQFKRELEQCDQNRVQYQGFVGRDAIQEMYWIADLFCAPSIVEETFGLVIAEAMASGLPVITSTRGGIPELVGDCGFTTDMPEHPADIIRFTTNLLERDQLRKDIGRRARDRIVNSFSWENTAAATEQLYRQLAGHV